MIAKYLLAVAFIAFFFILPTSSLSHPAMSSIPPQFSSTFSPVASPLFTSLPSDTYLIEIPRIAFRANIIESGFEPNDSMRPAVPERLVGWFNLLERPMEFGNTLLLGHTPGVFSGIERLREGDIVIIRSMGESAFFRVIAREQASLSNINMLYSLLSHPLATSPVTLNLMTCAGEFSEELGTYLDRLTIYTEQINHP